MAELKPCPTLSIKPIHLAQAREFVGQHHRHNIPPVGGKFAVACYEGDTLCGVAICGRPTARRSDDGETLEIYRNCTDGTRNACSKLYGACLRIAKNMGYKRVLTYTLESENGASLKASNFVYEGEAGGIAWTGKRKRDYYISPEEMKNRWAYYFGMADVWRETVSALDMAISALSEQPRWIPVEERLPEKKGQYLVYTKWTYGNFIRLCNWTPKYNGWEEHLNGRAIWYNYDSEYGDYECKDITHWMPLPEPPKEEV